jgi:hypothetical protein
MSGDCLNLINGSLCRYLCKCLPGDLAETLRSVCVQSAGLDNESKFLQRHWVVHLYYDKGQQNSDRLPLKDCPRATLDLFKTSILVIVDHTFVPPCGPRLTHLQSAATMTVVEHLSSLNELTSGHLLRGRVHRQEKVIPEFKYIFL